MELVNSEVLSLYEIERKQHHVYVLLQGNEAVRIFLQLQNMIPGTTSEEDEMVCSIKYEQKLVCHISSKSQSMWGSSYLPAI